MSNMLDDDEDSLEMNYAGRLKIERLSTIENWSNFKSLKKLDLNNNSLKVLPSTIQVLAPTLDILFLSENEFDIFPEVIGKLKRLRVLSLRGNFLRELSSSNIPSSLVWLILTNNRIARIDANMQKLKKLRKLMLSHNAIPSIPPELGNCSNLELIRLANNKINVPIPEEVLSLPKLAWISLAGNPIARCPKIEQKEILKSDLSFDESAILGKGASGTVFRGNFNGKEVAVKIFKKQSMGSDGNPEDEAAINALVDHPLAVSALGVFRAKDDDVGHEGMVMELLDGARPLGKVPSFDTVTRDYGPTENTSGLNRKQVLNVVRNVATALDHAHSDLGVSNGDVYLHNILQCEGGIARLSDWGASFVYDRKNTGLAAMFERIEVLAFGRLVQDLFDWHLNVAVPDTTEPHNFLGRSRGNPMARDTLSELFQSILQPEPRRRPSFRIIVEKLSLMPELKV